MTDRPVASRQSTLRMHIREFAVPPVQDGLVLGRASPIGCVAMRRALGLLAAAPFEHIEMPQDEVISDVLIRAAILKRLSKERLIDFVRRNIVPMMTAEEILSFHLEVAVSLEEKGE